MKWPKSDLIWDKVVCNHEVPIYVYDTFAEVSKQSEKVFEEMFSLEKQASQQIRGVLEEQPGTGGAPGQWGGPE